MVYDFSTNTLASLLIVATLQVLIYPLIAKSVSAYNYGLILTIMGIVNTIVNSLGNSLNNIRLVRNQTYENRGIKGDFNVILLAVSILGAIFTLCLILGFQNIGMLNDIILIFTVILGIVKSYFLVDYRLKLNFTLNLICNGVNAIGYVVGLFIFRLTNIWTFPFLMGEVFGVLFLLFTTDLIKEPTKTTEALKETFSSYLMLILTCAMATALSYMDRLIIFPLLGGEAVSTFTVATFFGKSIGLVFTPIAGVLLGYYAQKSFKFTRKLFWHINIIVLLFSAAFFGVSCIVSTWFTGILYPSLIESAKPYILIANLGAILGMTASMTQPAILKFAPMVWQIFIQLAYSVIYILLGIFMLKVYGISGFCICIIFANIVRLVMLYLVGHIYLSKGEKIYE
ncbi:lipopolysaccharide biosynthesis protein [Candidatus Clostridium stratigraminis]|uniref:Lipopolysaccharide biosynthesis protein n=1 Tax=Candidatus Clostridium stratigraminis TaxID=3381661 RepID=A0ABW8T4T1_9CLOT